MPVAVLEEPGPTPLRIHPNLAKVYKQKVTKLIDCLNKEDIKAEATEIVRDLVDKIVLHPDENGSGLKAVLYGDLAQVLAFCENAELKKDKPAVESAGCQLSVVAGARYQRCLHLDYATF